MLHTQHQQQSKAADLKKASFKERGFGWRRRLQAVSRELTLLEKQEAALSQVYPQGEDPELLWALTVAYYYAQLPLGVLSAVLSLLWLLQVLLYIFLGIHPFLNVLFVALDRAFGLLGVAAYAIFCFYLIGALCCFWGVFPFSAILPQRRPSAGASRLDSTCCWCPSTPSSRAPPS